MQQKQVANRRIYSKTCPGWEQLRCKENNLRLSVFIRRRTYGGNNSVATKTSCEYTYLFEDVPRVGITRISIGEPFSVFPGFQQRPSGCKVLALTMRLSVGLPPWQPLCAPKSGVGQHQAGCQATQLGRGRGQRCNMLLTAKNPQFSKIKTPSALEE